MLKYWVDRYGWFGHLAWALSLFGCWCETNVRADTLELHTGGRIFGKIINSEVKNPEIYEIVSDDGTVIHLKASLVKGRTIPLANEQSYERSFSKADDAVESHAKYIEDCLKLGMPALANAHRERLVEIAPDHALSKKAWAGLGYLKSESGNWVRVEKRHARLGLTEKGDFPEDILIQEAEEQAKIAKATASKNLDMHLKNIRDNNRRKSDSVLAIQTLEDPLAIGKIQSLLTKDQNSISFDIAGALVDTLGRMRRPDATACLVEIAIHNENGAIRDRAIDYLKKNGSDSAVVMLIGRLRHDPKKPPLDLQRAAYALGQFNDVRAIRPLISVLVTQHQSAPIVPPGNQAGFDSTGGTNFGSGGKPKIVVTQSENREVLQALQTLTKENFRFDSAKWIQWYAHAFAHTKVELRRDP